MSVRHDDVPHRRRADKNEVLMGVMVRHCRRRRTTRRRWLPLPVRRHSGQMRRRMARLPALLLVVIAEGAVCLQAEVDLVGEPLGDCEELTIRAERE